MAYIALGAVILAVCSWISIPTPIVPFTLQTFGVFFLIYYFGAKKATASLVVYIALGAIGIPVFSNFTSGFGVLMGATGGYILGFVVSGDVCIATESLFGNKWQIRVVSSILAILACYAVGSARAMQFVETETDFLSFFIGSLLAFGVFDVVKIVFAFFVARYLKKIKLN
ncbi:MAG: biotin transporter BioY [Clostridia bacterium]|nr:biotin transporter BioY [Clostridia bacterium]